MKSVIIIIFSLFILIEANAQIDLTVQYEKNAYTSWEEIIQVKYGLDNKLLDHGIYAAAGYRIYPFSFRLGFIPELGYSYATGQSGNLTVTDKYNITQAVVKLGIQLFPFDLNGDCNCPSFGRQNDFFQKAFYIKVIPGASYQWLNLEGELNANNYVFSVGAATGLNIALSELLTIAPEINYQRIFNAKWEGFSEFQHVEGVTDETAASTLGAGIRLSFYFN